MFHCMRCQIMTALISSNITSLSLIPLLRAEIADACKPCTRDCDELKSLKKLIIANIDKYLPRTDCVGNTAGSNYQMLDDDDEVTTAATATSVNSSQAQS